MNKTLQEDIEALAGRFALTEELQGRTILVTGATGLIGRCLALCLAELERRRPMGMRLVCAVRDKDRARRLLGKWPLLVGMGCGDEELEACDVCRIDHIIHLASPTASRFFVECPIETQRTIVEGTRDMLELAARHNTGSMVYASSMEAYGTIGSDGPVSESMQGYVNPLSARSSYPMAKRTAECLCFAYKHERGCHVRIARLAQTFGPGIQPTDNRVAAQFARSIAKGEDITLHTDGASSSSKCYTTDAVEALLYIMLRGKDGEAYNVANEEAYCSIREMAGIFAALREGTSVRIEPDPDKGYPPATRLRLDASKLRALGWEPRYGIGQMARRLTESVRQDIQQQEKELSHDGNNR